MFPDQDNDFSTLYGQSASWSSPVKPSFSHHMNRLLWTKPAHKCYISIFICFSTKAAHLEIVHDLSAAAFIAALTRFISIRGKPRTLWSDNATKFVRAKNELAELKELFKSEPSMSNIIGSLFLPDHPPSVEYGKRPSKHHLLKGIWDASKTLFLTRIASSQLLWFEPQRVLPRGPLPN